MNGRTKAFLLRQFQRALDSVHPTTLEAFERGDFLVIRFHRELHPPQTFWQVAGRPAKDIQKHLHDVVAVVSPEVVKKYQEGNEIVIKVPPIGLGHVSWEVKSPDVGWLPRADRQPGNDPA